ncbi:hypothetical protein BN948_04977 [Hydrogenophaga intermedia]|uniref:Uncharacterized protein n=1 Tax=Hydrogenophaga intermedia TaxID=65786 RepID=A0A1L1PKJ9_HYDIT|nr:hypothetical protein BN948_04977 [Hydrogenophaga intermedia]
MKDHKIAKLVNDLRDVAIEFRDRSSFGSESSIWLCHPMQEARRPNGTGRPLTVPQS